VKNFDGDLLGELLHSLAQINNSCSADTEQTRDAKWAD
jgi:hypothetical protein